MGSLNVNIDYRELTNFSDKIRRMGGDQNAVDEFYRACAKELAARLLAKVIRRTPVGTYDTGNTGMIGGTLRRGWTGGTDQNAGLYAQSLNVSKNGSDYVIEVTNPVEYASYVEFGHRQTPGRFVPAIGKRLKQSWVDGQFMLTISENELRTSAPAVIESKLNRFLREHFG